MTSPSKDITRTHLEPTYRICSQNQARVNVSTMVGKANANHDAKLITSPF